MKISRTVKKPSKASNVNEMRSNVKNLSLTTKKRRFYQNLQHLVIPSEFFFLNTFYHLRKMSKLRITYEFK